MPERTVEWRGELERRIRRSLLEMSIGDRRWVRGIWVRRWAEDLFETEGARTEALGAMVARLTDDEACADMMGILEDEVAPEELFGLDAEDLAVLVQSGRMGSVFAPEGWAGLRTLGEDALRGMVARWAAVQYPPVLPPDAPTLETTHCPERTSYGTVWRPLEDKGL